MPKLADLRDTFDGTDLDPAKWSVTGTGVEVTLSALRMTPDNAYSTVTSVHSYDLTQSEVVAELQALGPGETREFTLAAKVNSDNEVSFFHANNTLTMRLRVAGVNNDTTVAIDRDTMLFWRIRERAGIVYWDTSADGVVWDARRVVVHGIDLSSVVLHLRAGFYGTSTYGGGEYGSGLYGGVSGVSPDWVSIFSINPMEVVPVTVPPVVMPEAAPSWQWAVGNWQDSLPSTELIMAGARSLSLHLKDPSEARFTTWGYAEEASNIDELITDLWVSREGQYLFRGRVVNADDALEADTYSLGCTCLDYRGVLDRRLLFSNFLFTSQEQGTAVLALLDHTQSQENGSLGIELSDSWPYTGVLRTVEFQPGDSVWGSIKKLGEMDGGFELDFDHLKVANLYYPKRGVDNGEVLDFGGIVTRVRRVFDPSKFANIIRQSGASGVTPVLQFASNFRTAPEGRWEGQYGDPELRTNDAVAKTAAAKILGTSRLLPTYQLTLAQGAWRGPGHIWLGDYVMPVVKAGRLAEVTKSRVYDIDIDVDVNNRETVTITVGDPRIDVRSYLRGITKNLQILQKLG